MQFAINFIILNNIIYYFKYIKYIILSILKYINFKYI